MFAGFPADAIPDGAVIAPHHYVYGMLLVGLVAGIVWDDYRHREPLFTAVGVGLGLFGFVFTWPFYPVAGAVLSLFGPVVSIMAVVAGYATPEFAYWDDYPVRYRIATLVFSLIALDDAVEHAFGVATPLDVLWNAGLADRAPLVAVVLVAVGLALATAYAVYAESR